jgi:predicted acetyltransferase
MIEVRRSIRAERDGLYELWAHVFSEDRQWLDRFFSLRYSPEDIFIARVDGVLASALHALPASYVQGNRERRCSYIVGAATDERYRRRGLMGQVLEHTAAAYDHPITLFPAVREFYGGHGYHTTSSLLSFPLQGQIEGERALCGFAWTVLDRIYRSANEERGYLVRDEAAWGFLTSGYETVCTQDAYAFVSDGKAVEAFALTQAAARRLLEELTRVGVSSLQCLANSPLSRLLGEENGVPTPMGMSTHPSMDGVYIAEQY